MQHVFWVVPNLLAGRSGPDRQPWSLSELRGAGIGAVLSVNDGVLCHLQDFERREMAYACIPLSPNAPPRPGDLEHCLSALPVAYTFVTGQLEKGCRVLVHCSSGKDRTGLFFGYFFMRYFGQSVPEAIANVVAARPIAFTAEGWREFAPVVLSAVAADSSFKAGGFAATQVQR